MNKSLIFFLLLLSTLTLTANNIRIENARLASQNTFGGFYMVEFDLTWENSWRTSTYESNWDAAWVFIKFTPKDERAWEHASLHYVNGTNDGHVVPTGATYVTGPDNSRSYGVGVFIYRDSDGFGPVDYQNVQLRWATVYTQVITIFWTTFHVFFVPASLSIRLFQIVQAPA
jgi:hypothetical protein